ncbi:hypothetical protein [Streptomyces sp. NPDC050988]|uniref:hypothetical protein n=1 Tax=Streptomyces sp. NPDC050988 TaxID=3365637 RepID=UPI00379241C4
MVFPQTPLEVLVELFYDGAWHDITDDVYVRDGINITRGRADYGQRVDPSKCTLTFNNGESKVAPGVIGRYSPRNPRSDLFGKIGRNTPIRVSVLAGGAFLGMPGAIGDRAATPDAAALDITGDFEVRADAQLTNWLNASGALATTEIVGKLAVTTDKSWFLGVRQNRIYFEWSADGTNALGASSTVQPVIPPSGRLSVRATLDVNNGAGGRTITFYTSPSGTSGPWSQLGDPVVQSGTTSIFNSAVSLRVGDATNASGMTPAAGRCYAVEVRNGIDGTIVANPDFSAQAPGTTSFTDDAGRLWTMAGNASITNRRTRFVGEVSSWPARWDVSGKDVYVTVEASGLLRRLGQGAAPLQSTLRRRIPSIPRLLAYWPMEDQAAAKRAASPLVGVLPLKAAPMNWAAVDSLASSSPLPTIKTVSGALTHLSGRIPVSSTPSTSWLIQYVYRLDTVNTTLRTILRVLTSGTVAEWLIQMNSTTSRILGKDSDGNTLFTSDYAIGSDLYNQWIAVDFFAIQDGPNVDFGIVWQDIGGDAGSGPGTVAGTVGRLLGVASPDDGYSPDIDGLALGHISAWNTWDTTTAGAYDRAIDAWAGETAGARMIRLAEEEDLPLTVLGDTSVQERVGVQRPATLLSLLEDAAEADGGILYEQREGVGLVYRDRVSLYNQTPALELNYTEPGHIAPPLEPVDDDQKVANDVTVERAGGSSGRAVLEEGPLSIQAAPNGVGVYQDSVTLNLHLDAQTQQHAGWRMHLGTVDEARYPVVHIDLAAAPSLIDAVTDVDSGDRLTISDPPEWLAPGLIDLLAQGYTERIGHPIDWDLYFNCTPGGPWAVAVYDADRRDTAGSQLAAAIDDDDTTVPVLTTLGPLWTTAYPSLTVNPDFEEDLTGWSASGGVIDRVTAPLPKPFEADWALFFVPDGVSQFPNAGTDQVGVVVGRQYVASGWLRCSTTRSVALNVNWFNVSGTYLDTAANDVAVEAGVWTWFEKIVTPVANSVTANLAATVADFPPSTDVLWVHQATLRPASSTPENFPIYIRTGGEVMTVTAATPALVDTFTRTTTPGWGTPDIGAAWVSTGGAAADHYTQGSEAAHQLTAVDVARLDLTPVAGTDHDVWADVATAALATGGPQLVSVVARATDDANCYLAQLSISTSQVITLTLRKRVAGVETQLDTFTTSLVHSAFTFYRLRLKVSGSKLQARVRQASAAATGNWQVSAIDTSLTTGSNVGLRSVRQTANSNANLIVSYDNMQLLNPQRFTVERSHNGIIKAHAAGSGVALAKPAIRAL